MPSCAFPKCKNTTKNQNKSLGITFHAFPCDVAVHKKWVDNVRAARRDAEWSSNKYSRVCSNHFAPGETYMTKRGMRKINKTAVPQCQDLAILILNARQIKKEPDDEKWKEVTKVEQATSVTNSSDHCSGDSRDTSEFLGEKEGKRRKFEDATAPSLAVVLRDIRSQLHALANQQNDSFDRFGKYIAEMLRSMPTRRALELQSRVVKLITSLASDDDGEDAQSPTVI